MKKRKNKKKKKIEDVICAGKFCLETKSLLALNTGQKKSLVVVGNYKF